MSGGYTPLFDSLTRGTLCGRWPDIGLWPIVLSLADKDGVVDVIPRAIASLSGLSEKETVECLSRFEALGWLDRIYDHLDWGWQITDDAELPCLTVKRLPWPEWNSIRTEVFARDQHTCQYCGQRSSNLHCDHIIPISRGGSNDLQNLVTACPTCNQSKRDKTPDEWRRALSREH